MPVIHVYGFERPIEKKREIVKGLTDATCVAYDISPDIVTVYLHDLPKENAGHGGRLVFDTE